MLASTLRLGLCLLVTLFALSLGAVGARADAIMEPPDDCPDGLQGGSSHGGPFCQVLACSEERYHPDDCPPGSHCERRRYCVRERTGYSIGGPFTETVAVRACAAVSDCDPGDRCEESDHCVPFAASTHGRVRIAAVALAAVALVAIVAVVYATRRRHSPG